ncbi:MAG: glycosyltransferase [Candidatus Dormibacteraeota bacterium]|nr:glycosyltransferase [Candidatus Dormibacteraeota bacterium]MBV9524890.1 glycosyltransferase [Candidatus Dormibacteraeota bacterium]
MRITYVVPAHNQETTLPGTMPQLAQWLRRHPGSEIVLVENGSADRSMAVCVELAARLNSAEVTVRAVSSARGMGNALRRGMQLARGELVVLTAADLPFGFTDIDALLALPERPALAIGSKAHPGSRVQAPLLRRVMSDMFRRLRVALVGLRVGDSQGTILIDGALARRVLPHLRCGDFLFSTELVCWAAREGVVATELPITYAAGAGSTVSPVRDSLRMGVGLLALRKRLRAAAVAPAREARA